jgi:ATP-dependent DNA helicase 2 subunit 2
MSKRASLIHQAVHSFRLTVTVPPKAKGRKRNRDADKPLSGLDVDSLLSREKRIKISPDNPIPEFKQMLSNTEDISGIQDAITQLSTIIESRIKNSMGDTGYERAAEEIGAMRSEMLEFEEPGLYNEFLRGLKKKLLEKKLGGDRREMWWVIRSHRLGLIDKALSPQSDVEEKEAKEVS